MTKQYTKGDLTVTWKPDVCIHSRKCFNGLAMVFNPANHPWVNMDGAEAEAIKQQIQQCPSGALSYTESSKEKTADDIETHVTTAVEVIKNGPLMVYGNIVVKDGKGNELKKNKVTAFCRCGASANKPFCDGSHIKIGFKD